MEELEIHTASPFDQNVIPLIESLSESLGDRFGSDGRNSFSEWKENDPKFIFIKACRNDEVVGCGAVRPITNSIGEVKRMYSKYQRMGIGAAVLTALESEAGKAGYLELWLETRVKNVEACMFYQKFGYTGIENYGRYKNKPEASCFGKKLNLSPAEYLLRQ